MKIQILYTRKTDARTTLPIKNIQRGMSFSGSDGDVKYHPNRVAQEKTVHIKPKRMIPFTRQTFFTAPSSVLHSRSTILLDEKITSELIDVVIPELYKTSPLLAKNKKGITAPRSLRS